MCTCEAMEIERIILGMDYPYKYTDEYIQLIQELSIQRGKIKFIMAMQNKLESIYSGGIETTIKKIDFEAYFMTQDLVDALYESNRYPRLLEDHAAKTRRTYFTVEGAE